MNLRHLWQLIASTAEPDGDAPAETEAIPSIGEGKVLETSFAGLRSAIPVIATLTPRTTGIAMTQDEVIGWDMLRQHGFSRAALEADGVLADYLALNINPEFEARWLGEYMEDLLNRYPEGFEEALLLIVEYADAPMLERAAETVDHAVDCAGTGSTHIPEDCRKLLMALDTDVFESVFAGMIRRRVLETVRRYENLMAEYDPEGKWRSIAADIRDKWGRS